MCVKCYKILISKSNDTNWEIAKLEWDGVSLNNDDLEYCICGNESGDCFSLTNRINGENCIIGRICILNPKFNIFNGNNQIIDLVTNAHCQTCNKTLNYTSFKSHLKSKRHLKIIDDIKKVEEQKILNEQLNIIKRKENEDRRLKLQKENEKLQLKESIKRQQQKEAQDQLELNYRICQKCFLHKIKKSKPSKNIFCTDCFISYIAKNSDCPDCDRKITNNQLNTYKRCYECCLKNKNRKNY